MLGTPNVSIIIRFIISMSNEGECNIKKAKLTGAETEKKRGSNKNKGWRSKKGEKGKIIESLAISYNT